MLLLMMVNMMTAITNIDADHNDDVYNDNDDHDNDDDHDSDDDRDDDDDDNARWGRSAGEGHGRSLSVSCLQ